MSLNDNVLIKIRDMRESFTPVERLVGDYILENTEEIPHLSIKELAQSSKTSDASVLRFCKTMGYSGYRNFIVSISASLGSRDEDSKAQYTDIQPGDDLSTIISNISLNNCKSIEDTLSVIDRKEITRAVELLCHSKRIVFFGIGASGLVCMDGNRSSRELIRCVTPIQMVIVSSRQQLYLRKMMLPFSFLTLEQLVILLMH